MISIDTELFCNDTIRPSTRTEHNWKLIRPHSSFEDGSRGQGAFAAISEMTTSAWLERIPMQREQYEQPSDIEKPEGQK